MSDLIVAAIPFFVLLMAVEIVALHVLGHHDHGETAGDGALTPAGATTGPAGGELGRYVGYSAKDTATSLSMGLGNVGITAVWKLVLLVVYAAAYELTPLRIPMDAWWAWVLLLVGEDLCFYLYHRSHHTVRLFWASHVVHHSSEHFNLSTALRQDWSPVTAAPFWIPLALVGFPPWAILLAHTISLIYQFGLHTERIDRLPRPIELVMNTPSHHRVHHGSQAQYLDRNYAGVLIVWDRLFGTFEPEGERVRYGLTTNIETHNPVKVAYGEFFRIAHDVRHARTWRERLGHVFAGPGWSPGGEPSAGGPPAGAAVAAAGPATAPVVPVAAGAVDAGPALAVPASGGGAREEAVEQPLGGLRGRGRVPQP